MTKKSPILAVNEPVKKTTRKRPATRKATGSKKTASGRTSGRTSKGKKTIRRWQMPSWCYYLLLGFIGACFVICFLLFLYSSVRLPLETLLWHESIRGMSAIRI